MALAASYFIQLGAGVFALAVVARVVSAAPPRSLAILEGPYRYDSGAFWQVAPAITAALFLLAIAANWRSRRRGLLVGALAAFVLSGAVAGGVLAPLFVDIAAAGAQYAIEQRFEPFETIVAGDWAFQRGVERMCVTPRAGGEPRVREQRALLILQRGVDGRWRYARGMTNGFPAPQATDRARAPEA